MPIWPPTPMGTEHFIVKCDVPECFDLHKGGWLSLFGLAPSIFILRNLYRNATELGQAIEKMIIEDAWDVDSPFVYSQALANRLWAWAGWKRCFYITDSSLTDLANADDKSAEYYVKQYDLTWSIRDLPRIRPRYSEVPVTGDRFIK